MISDIAKTTIMVSLAEYKAALRYELLEEVTALAAAEHNRGCKGSEGCWCWREAVGTIVERDFYNSPLRANKS